MIDWNTYINTWNIRKQTKWYLMFLKWKRSGKVKAKWCDEGQYHRNFNHELRSSSHFVPSCAHKGSCVMNAMDYNYKLRSVIGREDDFTTNKRTWFDAQVCATFFLSWMISLALADYTDIGRIICCILHYVLALHVSLNDSIGSVTSYFHVSKIVHSGSNTHLQLRNLIHGNMISSALKKRWKGKVSLKNGIIGVDHKMTINMSMKHLYIAARYFYITKQLISGDISRDIYKPTKTLKSNYFT